MPESLDPGSAGPEHWETVADHLGSAYLRYSFTKGTEQEVAFLVDDLGLAPGMRVLDVGCGPGRHARALAARGITVHGVDISQTFIDLARAAAPAGAPDLATFQRLDARDLDFDSEFDAVICLCQGAFGVMTASGDDHRVFARMAAALRPGGRLALSAFSSYFVVRYHDEATFDAASGISHERTTVKDPSGVDATIDLWTGCYTPRELRLLCELNGVIVERISSVEPGRYGVEPASTESPEFLLIGRRGRTDQHSPFVGIPPV